MITWIQIVLQKHHKPVFMVLLVAIVIAFVFTIGQVPFLGDRNRAWDNTKEFYGFDLSNENVQAQLQNCAIYDAILAGVNIRTRQQLSQLMLRQAYLLSVARELGMSQVSEAELAAYVRSAPAFTDESGKFNAQLWEKFMSERGRMSEETLSYILSENALANKVEKLLGGPGYMPASYIEGQYKKFYGKWDFAVAKLSFKDFKPQIKVTTAELEKFFKANIEAYRIGEGVVLETVFFPTVQYASKVTAPTNADIAAYYGANMRNYATQKDGKPYIPSLSEVSEKVKVDVLADSALRAAAKDAENFAMKIYNSEIKMGSAELKKLLSETKAEIKKLPLIRKTDEKLPDGVALEVAQAGMMLADKTFFSDPIPSDKGVTVVLLTEKAPSFLPELKQVKARVEADYIVSERQKLFAERGATLAKALKKASDEKSFDKIAKEGGAKVEQLKDYVIATARPDNAAYAQYTVISSELPKLKAGEISPIQTVAGDSYILYAAKFTAPAPASGDKNFTNLKTNIERSFSAISANNIVSEMIAKESAAAKTAEE